ncbi:DUF3775 domain-containing protein [Aliiroseovarius sp. PTFE2010]|uniref:DUF3775 domain-containing protein n=1 Tax=Aliiroseovarius sp. PTFE2010 TaxID=3417190 RepID=UPI003CF5B276
MELSERKIAYVVVRARELEAKVGRWDAPGDVADADTILENRGSDLTDDELTSFIDDMNSDEKSELVALTWIGRETFTADDWREAVQTARNERITKTSSYLLGIPLLSDYLQSGAEAMGLDIQDDVDDLYAHH